MANRVTLTTQIVVGCLLGLATGCKPTSAGNVATSATTPSPVPTATVKTQAEQNSPRKLTAAQWFSKQNISPEEARTVDAIISSIESMGGPESKGATLGRWAERNVQMLALDNLRLTEISPVLVFKNLTTISLIGNKLTQKQINEILTSLPKLKILTIDSGLNCDVNRKVTCLH